MPGGKRLWMTLGVVALVVALAVVLLPRAGTRDLRASLAEALNVAPRDFFLNIPPAPNRYPGSVFATEQWLPLERVDANDTTLQRSAAPFTLRLARLDDAAAQGGVSSGFFGEVLRHRRALDVDVRIDSATVLEVPVQDLKRRLLASDAVRSALDRGARPVVVTRAYEGIVTLTLRRRREASGEAWAAVSRAVCTLSSDCPTSAPPLANDTTRLSGSVSGADTLTVSIPQRVVFAYQVMQASFITTHLGAAGPDSVVLRPVRDTVGAPDRDAAGSGGRPPSDKWSQDWALVTIANGYYPKLQTRSQPWNAVSAAVVRDALGVYRPRWIDSLAATPGRPLVDSGVVAFAVAAARRAKAAGARALVLYYIGHVFAVPGRDVSLLMGDAAAVPDATGRTPAAPPAPAERGGPVDALSRFADELSAHLAEPQPGLLELGRLHAALDSIGLPFALLIDGCLESDEVARFRQQLGFVLGPGTSNHLDYIGPNALVTWEPGAYADMLRHYADGLPYLHDANPVVLAAKPGTLAMPSRDPRWAWGDPVGPLAARVATYVRASRLDPEPPDLGEVIRQSAEYRGLGEIRPRGSISWSDFERWRQIAGAVRPTEALASRP